MKKVYIKILAVILLSFGYSCSGDWLDLTPSDGSSREEAIRTYDDAFTVLSGVYDALQGNSTSPNYTYYGAGFIYYGDVRGDDMQSVNSGKRTAPAYMMNYTLDNAPDIWEVPYKVIRRSNSLMKAINDGLVQGAIPEDLDNLVGQALAIRALAHFDLLRVYSLPYDIDQNGSKLGIPIVLEPTDANSMPARNSIAAVYEQIEKDLTTAISLMKESNGTGYFNKWAAKALLARVYLYKGTAADNLKAYDTAVQVIEASSYKLWTTSEYAEAWSKAGTSEVLFEIVNAGTDDWLDREGIGYLLAEKGYDDAIMTKSYVDFVETSYAGDVRLGLMKMTTSTTHPWAGRKAYVDKYPGRQGASDFRVNNIPVLRLSETYLIAAEAAAKLNRNVDAAKYLNDIIKRGDPSVAEISPSAATLDRILQEKRIEFVGEGHRYFDLIRNNKTITRYTDPSVRGWHILLNAKSAEFDRNYFGAILPIPVREINANQVIKLEQNPGY